MNRFLLLISAILIAASSFSQTEQPWGRVISARKVVASGEGGSKSWRIPAIISLPDSSLLMTIDRRKFNDMDLPEDIDIVVMKSKDLGETWTSQDLAVGQGFGNGFGDAALVLTENNDIVCVYVGGNGLWHSIDSLPIRSYVTRSHDFGHTWEPARDITSSVWGPKSKNPSYRGAFFASGNGLRIQKGPHKGRIMFVSALRRRDRWSLDNYVFYSDDHGDTWNSSEMAFCGGDEAKLVELEDGRILMSVRQTGARGYNISTDGGKTWEDQRYWPSLTANACNGDIIRYTANGKDILLHSIPNSMERENVSIFISRDNGLSWGEPLQIVDGKSVYSSMTVMKDGRIAMLVERNEKEFEIWLYIIEII